MWEQICGHFGELAIRKWVTSTDLFQENFPHIFLALRKIHTQDINTPDQFKHILGLSGLKHLFTFILTSGASLSHPYVSGEGKKIWYEVKNVSIGALDRSVPASVNRTNRIKGEFPATRW